MSPATAVVSKTYTKEELCLMEPQPDACAIVIFGASGDLAHRKLIPALYQLAHDNVLPKGCYILGLGRTKMTDEQFQKTVKESLQKGKKTNGTQGTNAIDEFCRRCTYLSGDYNDPAYYTRLKQQLAQNDQQRQIPGRRRFSLSPPPP